MDTSVWLLGKKMVMSGSARTSIRTVTTVVMLHNLADSVVVIDDQKGIGLVVDMKEPIRPINDLKENVPY